MSKKVKIFDNKNIEVEVKIESFYQHLLKYHSTGVSLHEEDGHYFTVNNQFREKIKQLLDLS